MKKLASGSVTLALHQYTPVWLVFRGEKVSVIVVDGEELDDITSSNESSSIGPSGPFHSMTGFTLRSCDKETLQVML